jgi:hypothetical protein
MNGDTLQFVTIVCLAYAIFATYGAIMLVFGQRRFSLRGLMIFMALFSVVAGLFSVLSRWPK